MTANGKQVATDFEKIINAARDRKKNEALAAQIFNRRSSTPSSQSSKHTPTGPLASRAGVKKQRLSTSAGSRQNGSNVNGEWTHDLHWSQPSTRDNSPRPNSLAARITNPNAGPAGNPREKRRAAQVAQALIRSELQPKNASSGAQGSQASSGGSPAASFNRGMTIRGLAGPFAVMAQNFAPGTTAADIESAMTPIGGIVTSCKIVKTHPIVIAEIVFESKEGADNVISTFNNQTADGRVLSVYPKLGGASTTPSQGRSTAGGKPPSAPRAERNDIVVDGTMGFDDPMEMDTNEFPNGNGRQPPKGPAALNSSSGLHSDNIIRNNGNRRGGRGFGGGRGGGRR